MCWAPLNSHSVTGRHELISASLSQQLTERILYARGCTAVDQTSQSPQLLSHAEEPSTMGAEDEGFELRYGSANIEHCVG